MGASEEAFKESTEQGFRGSAKEIAGQAMTGGKITINAIVNQCQKSTATKPITNDLINNCTGHNQDHLLQELSEYGQLGVRGASQIIQVGEIHDTSFS